MPSRGRVVEHAVEQRMRLGVTAHAGRPRSSSVRKSLVLADDSVDRSWRWGTASFQSSSRARARCARSPRRVARLSKPSRRSGDARPNAGVLLLGIARAEVWRSARARERRAAGDGFAAQQRESRIASRSRCARRRARPLVVQRGASPRSRRAADDLIRWRDRRDGHRERRRWRRTRRPSTIARPRHTAARASGLSEYAQRRPPTVSLTHTPPILDAPASARACERSEEEFGLLAALGASRAWCAADHRTPSRGWRPHIDQVHASGMGPPSSSLVLSSRGSSLTPRMPDGSAGGQRSAARIDQRAPPRASAAAARGAVRTCAAA